MRRQYTVVASLFLSCISRAFAVQPNYVQDTLFNVDGSDSKVISTGYSDGLGRGIQTKLKLDAAKDRVSITYYDEAGRPDTATRTFVDTVNEGSYLPGAVTDDAVKVQLEKSNLNDTCAYSRTEYWDDPLGRVKKSVGPGADFTDEYGRSWTFGVRIEGVTRPDSVMETPAGGGTPVYIGTVTFLGGTIIAIAPLSGVSLERIFDALNDRFLTDNPFDDDVFHPTHFLTVALDAELHISETVTDVFGRTIATFTGPDIGIQEGTKLLTRYDHDILGNVLTENAPAAGGTPLIDSTRYTYNTLGQVVTRITPDGGIEEYYYNVDGSLQEKQVDYGNYNFRKLRYYHDALGRLTRVYEYDLSEQGANGQYVISKYYDDMEFVKKKTVFSGIDDLHLGRVENIKGRLSGQVYSNFYRGRQTDVGEVFSYDDEGRLRFKITAIGGMPGIQETWYEYDIHGKVTADFCFYGGKIIKKKYRYDALGRLDEVYHHFTNDGGYTYDSTKVAEYHYNDLGVQDIKQFPAIRDPYAVGYAYDIRDRLTAITRLPGTKGFEEAITGYDKVGNITNAAYKYYMTAGGSPEEFTMTYTYDNLYRLTGATPAAAGQQDTYTAAYDYDNLGRFRSKTEGAASITGYEYYPSTSRLEKTGRNADGEAYVYDAFGNMVVDYSKKMVIEYDWRDMPVAYRFYSAIPSGITKDDKGTCTNGNLYAFLDQKVSEEEISLLSTVTMYYDAGGNRVGKVEVKE